MDGAALVRSIIFLYSYVKGTIMGCLIGSYRLVDYLFSSGGTTTLACPYSANLLASTLLGILVFIIYGLYLFGSYFPITLIDPLFYIFVILTLCVFSITGGISLVIF